MNGRTLTVLLLATLALLAAGCGGDDSSEAGGDTDTAIVEETNGEETTDDATSTDDDATETTEDDDLDLTGQCAEFAGLGTRITQALSGGTQDLEEAADLFDELASKVPDEIKADFQVIAENFSKIAEAVQELDLSPGETPSTADLAKLQELTASLSSPEVAAAGERIQAWVAENC
jgi:hypothetical protein